MLNLEKLRNKIVKTNSKFNRDEIKSRTCNGSVDVLVLFDCLLSGDGSELLFERAQIFQKAAVTHCLRRNENGGEKGRDKIGGGRLGPGGVLE